MSSQHSHQTSTHWHILGAGAIGSLWAYHMTQQGIPVTLLVRPERIPEHGNRAMLRMDHQAESTKHSASCSVELVSTADTTTISHLLVTTKAGDTLAILKTLRPRLSRDAIIVLLQNGMGHQQTAAQFFADYGVFAGSTTDGVWQKDFLHICRAGYGSTRFGPLNERAKHSFKHLHSLLHITGLKAEMSTNILAILQEKLAINAAINGLTIVHNCANGELLRQPYYTELTELCAEIAAILAEDGFQTQEPLLEKVEQVLTITANNISSSQQDFRNGRATELAYINGYLIERATALGIMVPAQKKLMQTITHRCNSLNRRA